MNANTCLITLSCFCGHFMLDLQTTCTCNEVNRSAVSRHAVVASSYGHLELKLPHAFGNLKWLPPPPLYLQNSSPRTPSPLSQNSMMPPVAWVWILAGITQCCLWALFHPQIHNLHSPVVITFSVMLCSWRERVQGQFSAHTMYMYVYLIRTYQSAGCWFHPT